MISIDRAELGVCLDVPRWIDEVLAGAPYASLEALQAAGDAAAEPLTDAEIDLAMAHHPRIGEAPTGEGAAQEHSRREQASLGDADAEVAAAIAQGNRDYEARFDRVFLIRAAGRTRTEILAELRRRIALPDDEERVIVGRQLHEIAVLRLEQLWTSRSIDRQQEGTA